MTLKELPIGKSSTLTVVGGEGALRQHFHDIFHLLQVTDDQSSLSESDS